MAGGPGGPEPGGPEPGAPEPGGHVRGASAPDGPDGPEVAGNAGAAAAWVPSDRQRARERARRRSAVRSALVAGASTIVVAVLAALLVTRSPGWPRVRETFLSWPDVRASFPDVVRGFWLNVRIFLVAEVLVLALGLLVAVLRGLTAPALFPLRVLAVAYTDLLRGVPTILVIFGIGFGVPALNLRGVPSDPVVLGTVALVLSYGAYVAEVYRAGIESVHPSQRAAARSLGLRPRQALRHVVLPQAVRRVVPPLLNDFVSLQKDTALVAVLGPLEAVRQAQIYSSTNFNYTPYLAASLLFVALTVPLARFTDALAARTARRRGPGGPA